MDAASPQTPEPSGAAPEGRPEEAQPQKLRLSRRAWLWLFLVGVGGLLVRHFQRRGEARPVLRSIARRPPAPRGAHGLLPAKGPGTLRFFAFGDIGWESAERDDVIAEARVQKDVAAPDAILLLGDNFYRDGVSSTEDEQWRTKFELVFPGAEFPQTFHACLGNHDYNGDVQAQVDYTKKSARWHMPERNYTFEQEICACARVQFFVLDTQPIWRENADGARQVDWLAAELARSNARWKIVIGHHCIVSGGAHGPMLEVTRALAPLLERHGVDLYLSGHDHDLQLLRSGHGWLHAIAGASSSTRDTGVTEDSLFAAAQPGFAALSLTHDSLRIDLIAAGEGPLFTHHVFKPKQAQSCDRSG